MTKQEFVAVGVRLFAVFLLVYLLRQSPYFVIWELPDRQLFVTVVAAVLMLLVAVGLWFFPKTVALNLLPPSTAPSQPASWSITDVWSAGAVLLGLFVLSNALPDVMYWVTLIAAKSREPVTESLKPQSYAAIVRLIGELGIGLWLLLGSRGLVRMVAALRGKRPD